MQSEFGRIERLAPILVGSDAERALHIARTIVERIGEPRPELERALSQMPVNYGEGNLFLATSLGSGYAGMALLAFSLSQALDDEQWDLRGHQFLQDATHPAVQPGMGVFAGWSGIIVAAAAGAARRSGRYSKLRGNLNRHIRSVYDQAPSSDFVNVAALELINGLSGTVLGLSLAGAASTPLPCFEEACCTFAERLPEPTAPDTDINLGLSHGVAGILATLAALNQGGATQTATSTIVEWLARCSPTDGGGRWAASIERGEQRPTRVAWCYGTPGVAAALSLAARALQDAHLHELARASLVAIASSNRSEWGQRDFSLCHGHMGNAVVFALLGQRYDDSQLRGVAHQLALETMSAFDPSLPFGYRAWYPGDELVDTPRVLEGAGGVALGLLTLAKDVDCAWLRAFALV
jgi:class I lanthipeptide synthase